MVEVRGHQFFVINASTGAIMGIYPDRVSAQNQADRLQTITYARFS